MEKKSAVEWFYNELKELIKQSELTEMKPSEFDDREAKLLEQAKEMEKQQQDEFAIKFAKWCAELKVWDNETYVNNTFEELLKQFKNK